MVQSYSIISSTINKAAKRVPQLTLLESFYSQIKVFRISCVAVITLHIAKIMPYSILNPNKLGSIYFTFRKPFICILRLFKTSVCMNNIIFNSRYNKLYYYGQLQYILYVK